jgi:hypothetical protein
LDDALAFYDSLKPIRAEDITGRWRGRELRTGHPMDGLLEASGWYGKQFDGVDDVHPLLFTTPNGEIFAVDPRRVPLGLAEKFPASLVEKGRAALGVLKPALYTRKPRARLRNIEHRGVVSAAMVYDHLPVIDHFRRVDDRTLLGCMDLRSSERPYFFILEQ